MKRHMLNVLLAVSCALSLATGCGEGNSGGVTPTRPTPVPVAGIQGVTQERIEGGAFTLTPRPPVINPLPHITLTVQAARGGHEIARPQSDANGHFHLVLPPGTYRVSPLRASLNFGLLPPQSQTVVVRPGNFSDLTFTYILEAP